ncbi:MAG: hypothetical protein N3J91_15670 [Verrucomicrobiae bacterium]|nr:hypothetical protein [Verrucomicrobiae bacterium]
MKAKVMRTLSIEIGRESYPRWPVPVVRIPSVAIWVAGNEAAGEPPQRQKARQAPCAHGMLIAAGALSSPLLPVVCHHEAAGPMVNF